MTAELERAHRALLERYQVQARANRDLEQFAVVAAHELSEPLRAMAGFAQLLERQYADVLDARGSRYVVRVADAAAHMRALVDDLLYYAQGLDSEPAASLVDPAAIARRVAASLGAPQVEIGELPSVWCDAASVTAVLQNLIGNAMKFHSTSGPARVVVTGYVDGRRVRLCVDDDGIGIGPDNRERVFTMFSRLHPREAYAGTGIGLAVVRRIAERSGGQAWAESSPLGGTRLCVTLPAPPHQERLPPA